jgi:hypothetical protein
MEVRIKGQMTIADIRPALFEQLQELETKYAVQFSRGATLYMREAGLSAHENREIEGRNVPLRARSVSG